MHHAFGHHVGYVHLSTVCLLQDQLVHQLLMRGIVAKCCNLYIIDCGAAIGSCHFKDGIQTIDGRAAATNFLSNIVVVGEIDDLDANVHHKRLDDFDNLYYNTITIAEALSQLSVEKKTSIIGVYIEGSAAYDKAANIQW
ncbi:hypothetical protein PR048_013820 [Dryococelus australis]|uniref:Uncharacterized protein n=1 Tax=Dryococelus australis TaxID=614101 RepID=A0ABQ9HUU6_9NEOP|nr:hypothetical protein PR048_013820 [Dryococelus australis]